MSDAAISTGVASYLAMIAEFSKGRRMPDGFAYHSVEEFLLDRGQPMPVATDQRTPRLRFWPKACFENAFRLAKKPGFRYVEGYALAACIPVYHAWCLNDSDEVVDPTWRLFADGVGTDYFGVVIDMAQVRAVRHREDHSVLMNWSRGYPLLRSAVS